MLGMLIVGWHLRDALAQGISQFLTDTSQKLVSLSRTISNSLIIFIILMFLFAVIAGSLILFKRRSIIYQGKRWKLVSVLKLKIQEVLREISDISFDMRLVGIILCSISVILFRFGTQWYLVRSMGIAISIWKLSFALLFGVLFSLAPIHGPAGLGTVEGPWVLALHILNVPEKDAIASGFVLHIIIIMYCLVLGLYGFIGVKMMNRQTIALEDNKN